MGEGQLSQNLFFIIFNKVVCCLFFPLIIFVGNHSSSIAATTDCQPADWSVFDTTNPVNGPDGNPIVDAEGTDDPSTGGAVSTGHQSFASNCEATGNVASSGCSLSNCNPALPSGRGCGLEPSFYFDCTTVGTVDVFFFRLRIDQDPSQGGNADLLENGKWNILMEYTNRY